MQLYLTLILPEVHDGGSRSIQNYCVHQGTVILPKAIRDQRRWLAGTRLTVEDTAEGVLLRPERILPKTTVDQVAGMLKPLYDGPPVSVEEMHEGVLREARRRYLNGEY